MSSTRTQFANAEPAPKPRTEAGAAANPVDLHVGARIRMRRKHIGLSQEKLAEQLGLTFQQVQKYERGANRVSASKLYEAAKALQVGVQYFFDGLADPVDEDAPAASDPVLAMMTAPYGVQLAADYSRLTNLDRSMLAGLARRFVDGAGDLPTAALSLGLSAAEMIEEDRQRIASKEALHDEARRTLSFA